MARAVFSAKALGLSKVLCSMDTINSYQASQVLDDGTSFVFFFSGISGNAGCFGKRGGGWKKRWVPVVCLGFVFLTPKSTQGSD